MKAGIMLDESGDLPDVPVVAADAAYVRQACAVALRIFLGEWVLDVAFGGFDPAWLSAKPAPVEAIERRARATLEAVEGVQRVARLVVTHDQAGTYRVDADVVVAGEEVAVSADAVAAARITGNAAPGGGPGAGFAGAA